MNGFAVVANREGPYRSSDWRATDDMDRPDSTTGDAYTLKVYAICATASQTIISR